MGTKPERFRTVTNGLKHGVESVCLIQEIATSAYNERYKQGEDA